MKTQIFSRDRLQPALLDRLIDDRPTVQELEPPELRVISKAKLRQSVLRDLNWLLNATGGLQGLDAEVNAHAWRSVVNFGLPPISGLLASKVELAGMEQWIRQAIIDFEPRIVPETLFVRGVEPENPLAHHNQIVFEITGQLWAQPYPLDVLFKTSVDLETGETQVDDPGLLAS